MRKPSLWTGVLGAAIALTMVARPAFAVQETKIGVTSASNLTTTGFPPVSPEHLLKIGVEVVGNERVITTKDGRAQLLFLDHSALTVGPNSNLVLDKFVYDPDAGVGELAFSATKGIFRLVGGRISKKTPVTIKTFSGTIGIRGGIAMVSIQEGGPVEAIFLFGTDMTVCTDTLPERERPRHQRPGEQCFAGDRGKLPEGTQQSSIGTEHCTCVTATRPGSLVTIPSPGNVSAPVILSAEQISATVQQLEQTPGKTTDTAVLVFQQEVKDAELGALTEPAAGPAPADIKSLGQPVLPTETPLEQQIAFLQQEIKFRQAVKDKVLGALTEPAAGPAPADIKSLGQPVLPTETPLEQQIAFLQQEIKFRQAVEDKVLGALIVPAAGSDPPAAIQSLGQPVLPNPTPDEQRIEFVNVHAHSAGPPSLIPLEDQNDVISDSTDETTSQEIAASPTTPPATLLNSTFAGRAKATAGGTVGTSDLDPNFNIPFSTASIVIPSSIVSIAVPILTYDLNGNTKQVPVTGTLLPSAPEGFTGFVTSGLLLGDGRPPVVPFNNVSGFLSLDQEFLFYRAEEPFDPFFNILSLVFVGVPTPASAFPTSGITAYNMEADFTLDSLVPFIRGVTGGNLEFSNFFKTIFDVPPAPVFVDWGNGTFGGALIAIDGQGFDQTSAASVFGGSVVNGTPATADLVGLMRGTTRLFQDEQPYIFDSDIELARDGNGNAFFGADNPDYFVFQSVGGATEEFEGTETTYFPNVVTHPTTTATIGTRTTRTLNGFSGGAFQRINGSGSLVSTSLFGNTNGDPADIQILTDPDTGTLTAVFDVQKIGALNANDDHLVASFGGTGRSAFFDDESFGALESGTLAQFTTVTNPAVNPFLVGGHLFRSNGTTGAGLSLGFRFTSNSSDFGTVFPIDLVGDVPDAGLVPREFAFELQPGDNVFNFPTSGCCEVSFYGLGLFFNDTGVTFNPAITQGTVGGDLAAFTTGDAFVVGGSTGFGTPAAGTLIRAFDSFTGAAAYSGDSSFPVGNSGSQVTITNFAADNNALAGAPFTATFTITVVSSGPTGPAVTGTDLYMVTSEAFQSGGFAPAGVTTCACQFLEWGFWGGEIRFAGGESERIHLATWLAGDNIAADIDLPNVGTADYSGHIIGTVLNTGEVYQAIGGFDMTFDFAAPVNGTTINVTSFDNVDYNANLIDLTNGLYDASGADLSALSRTINFRGAFFGGGGDPVAETGGQFNIDGGANYSASGIFAGAQ